LRIMYSFLDNGLELNEYRVNPRDRQGPLALFSLKGGVFAFGTGRDNRTVLRKACAPKGLDSKYDINVITVTKGVELDQGVI